MDGSARITNTLCFVLTVVVIVYRLYLFEQLLYIQLVL